MPKFRFKHLLRKAAREWSEQEEANDVALWAATWAMELQQVAEDLAASQSGATEVTLATCSLVIRQGQPKLPGGDLAAKAALATEVVLDAGRILHEAAGRGDGNEEQAARLQGCASAAARLERAFGAGHLHSNAASKVRLHQGLAWASWARQALAGGARAAHRWTQVQMTWFSAQVPAGRGSTSNIPRAVAEAHCDKFTQLWAGEIWARAVQPPPPQHRQQLRKLTPKELKDEAKGFAANTSQRSDQWPPRILACLPDVVFAAPASIYGAMELCIMIPAQWSCTLVPPILKKNGRPPRDRSHVLPLVALR